MPSGVPSPTPSDSWFHGMTAGQESVTPHDRFRGTYDGPGFGVVERGLPPSFFEDDPGAYAEDGGMSDDDDEPQRTGGAVSGGYDTVLSQESATPPEAGPAPLHDLIDPETLESGALLMDTTLRDTTEVFDTLDGNMTLEQYLDRNPDLRSVQNQILPHTSRWYGFVKTPFLVYDREFVSQSAFERRRTVTMYKNQLKLLSLEHDLEPGKVRDWRFIHAPLVAPPKAKPKAPKAPKAPTRSSDRVTANAASMVDDLDDATLNQLGLVPLTGRFPDAPNADVLPGRLANVNAFNSELLADLGDIPLPPPLPPKRRAPDALEPPAKKAMAVRQGATSESKDIRASMLAKAMGEDFMWTQTEHVMTGTARFADGAPITWQQIPQSIKSALEWFMVNRVYKKSLDYLTQEMLFTGVSRYKANVSPEMGFRGWQITAPHLEGSIFLESVVAGLVRAAAVLDPRLWHKYHAYNWLYFIAHRPGEGPERSQQAAQQWLADPVVAANLANQHVLEFRQTVKVGTVVQAGDNRVNVVALRASRPPPVYLGTVSTSNPTGA